MNAFVAFWKKDIINKLIVFISTALVLGAFVIAYLLLTMKSDSMFYVVFAPALGGDGIPTLAAASTVSATETLFVLPTSTSSPEAPTAELLIATLELPTATESPATITPNTTTPTVETLAPTASPMATPSPTQSAANAAACIPANQPQTGKVLDVIDGNTVKVLIDGIAYTVRYIGIDVPKFKPVAEYFGQEADFKNAEYVFAKQVTLVSDLQDKDESGRLLRYVKVGDIFVNYELVRQGFASASTASSTCAQVFRTAEQSAAQSKIGRWKPTPTLPAP